MKRDSEGCAFTDLGGVKFDDMKLWRGAQQKEKAPRFPEGPFDLLPAATYSPTRSPVQYHRRWRA